MSTGRGKIILSVLKGLLAAILFTLVWMFAVAGITLVWRLSDGLLCALNQILKITAILLGVCVSVGRGGSRGFVTGVVLATVYMTLGYRMYVALGGGTYSFAVMLGEILIGAAAGGLTGAVLANMNPPSKRKSGKYRSAVR